MSLWAIDGRGRREDAPPGGELPKKPPPPFGNWVVCSTIVIAPAAISVMSARYRPDRRSAGRPIRTPMPPVTSPAMSTSTGNGSRRRVAEPQRDPGADAGEDELAQRHHPDPADEQAETERDDAVDHDSGHDEQPVAVERAPGRDEDDDEEDGDSDDLHRADREVRAAHGRRVGGGVDGLLGLDHVPTSVSAVLRPHRRWRRRANHSRATIASTNGVIVRYSARLGERRQARLHDPDHEAGDERDPERLQLADQRRGQRRDDEERDADDVEPDEVAEEHARRSRRRARSRATPPPRPGARGRRASP